MKIRKSYYSPEKVRDALTEAREHFRSAKILLDNMQYNAFHVTERNPDFVKVKNLKAECEKIEKELLDLSLENIEIEDGSAYWTQLNEEKIKNDF